MSNATHGNVATHVGTCHTCGRENVDLHRARYEPDQFICVDEFACFAQWQRAWSRR